MARRDAAVRAAAAALTMAVVLVAGAAASVEEDTLVVDLMSPEERAIAASLTAASPPRDEGVRALALLSANEDGPPVLRLTDVTLSEIAEGDMYRFVLRLREGDDGACDGEELESMREALCAAPGGTSCVKTRGTNYNALPFMTVHFESLHELRRVREEFAHCIAWIERDVAEFALSAPRTRFWNLDRIDQPGRPLDGRFDSGGADGTGVHIFIVDTGVWASHEDFGGRVVITHTTVEGSSPLDVHGHGTHCAGVAASATFGVARNATVHSVKVLSDSGVGSSSDVIEALDFIIGTKAQSPGAPVVASLSLGGAFSTSLNAAVDEAMRRNITVITAAGNERRDACLSSPSSSNAITVGSVDNSFDDRVSSFSNYGDCVDIYAPGRGIVSTSTGWNVLDGLGFSDHETSSMEGTSMAAPHVSGAAALYLQQHPDATPTQVRQAIMAASVTAGAGRPPLLVIGGGLVPSVLSSDGPAAADEPPPANGTVVPAPPAPAGTAPAAESACEVTQWTSWTDCSARDACTTGLRIRYRFPANDIPLDLILIECPLLTTVEACVAPGECVDVGGPSVLEGIFADVMEMVSGFS